MKSMQSSIKVGDNVVTSGGMYGRVADVGQDCYIVEFGTNRGLRIPIRKQDILGIKSPIMTPPPAAIEDKKEEKKDEKETK
jgi:preprotein translocase subunit YajC